MDNTVQYTLSLKDLLTPKLKQADVAAGELEKKLTQLQTIVGSVFAVYKIQQWGAAMISAGTKVEDAITGLKTLTGSMAIAQKVVNDTMEDAQRTPFAFEGLLMANKALISAGSTAEEARSAVLDLGNAIAATGGGNDELSRMVINLQQIKNVGKASGMDIKQFAFAGINVYKVLEAAGVKYAKGAKDNQEITYETLTNALKVAAEKGGIYADGLQNMQKNTSIVMSNLGDSFFKLQVSVFKKLKPVIDWFLLTATKMISWMGKNKEIMYGIAAVVGVLVTGYIAWNALLVINNGLMTIAAIRMFAAQVAAWGLEAAMAASAVTAATMWAAATVGISLLVGLMVIAYNKFEGFRQLIENLGVGFQKLALFASAAWKVSNGDFAGASADMAKAYTLRSELEQKRDNEAALKANLTPARMEEAWAKNKNNEAWIAKYSQDPAWRDFIGGKQMSELMAGKKGDAAGGEGGGSLGSQASSISGSKPTNVYLNITNLVNELKIYSADLSDSSGKIKNEIIKALVEATTDATIIAGQ